jgi:hypothetical protein
MILFEEAAMAAKGERFEALLDRAIEEAHHVVEVAGRPGWYRVSSASVPGRYYTTSAARCSCPGGKAGCKHRALVLWLERECDEMSEQAEQGTLADGTPDDMRPDETAYQWAARHGSAIDYEALARAGWDGWQAGAMHAEEFATSGVQGWLAAARAFEAALREQGFAILRRDDVAALDAAWQEGGGQLDFAVACRIEAEIRPEDVARINALCNRPGVQE